MVRAYIVAAEGEGYTIEALGDAYGPGSIGFSAEVLSTEEATVLFGDIGSSLYDPTTDTRRDVTFTDVAAKLADGREVSISVQNNAPLYSHSGRGSRGFRRCISDGGRGASLLRLLWETGDLSF